MGDYFEDWVWVTLIFVIIGFTLGAALISIQKEPVSSQKEANCLDSFEQYYNAGTAICADFSTTCNNAYGNCLKKLQETDENLNACKIVLGMKKGSD